MLSEKPWFVKFFAPWCPHCQHMAATWEDFHAKHKTELNVASVDCTSIGGNPLCQSFGIRGYPTLLFMPGKGKDFFRFEGSRSVESFEKFSLQEGWKSAASEEIGSHKTLFEQFVKPVTDAVIDKLKNGFL